MGSVFTLFFFKCSDPGPVPYLQRTAAKGTLGQAGGGRSHSSHLPPVVKVGLVGPPRDQIQSNCCFALLSAYALSPIASQLPEEAGGFLRQGN